MSTLPAKKKKKPAKKTTATKRGRRIPRVAWASGGSSPTEIASPRKDEPTLSLAESGVSIGAGDAPAAGADVWLVSYDPALVQVPVKRGENDGRTLPHKNVVHELTKIGIWTGTALSIAFSAPKAGLRSAVLIQAPHGGPIIAAASY